ncbi:hypothetical protein B0T11DRAFT_271471 [Plectosphaerella cucumerina]|uniref:Uncharacterized protein n=1 Tax=Plectosphaerella cucumerina TaxID=40658 RepID=A0A8K0TU39_9PEZI|nr:hypothetical protein B0T11DRAFT_271471 [Plectosphaerella cucumerina]
MLPGMGPGSPVLALALASVTGGLSLELRRCFLCRLELSGLRRRESRGIVSGRLRRDFSGVHLSFSVWATSSSGFCGGIRVNGSRFLSGCFARSLGVERADEMLVLPRRCCCFV